MNNLNGLSFNDIAWENLFEKYDILNEIDMKGSFLVTSKQIRNVREPRLMAKFDHSVNLPDIFKENHLSILPVTRGKYIISHFKTHHNFETDNGTVIRADLPDYVQSVDINNISSESIALNCAAAAGIIEDFTNDCGIVPTVSGRMGSGRFDFNIFNTRLKDFMNINVENSQIEIDGAYEGQQYLTLFEAKCGLSDDFIVRQLYYPYRVWQKRVKKPVKTVFFVYSNGIYRLYEYCFDNLLNYNSLILVKQRKYSIEDTTFTTEDIYDILQKTVTIEEPTISFPQADSFERIINICEFADGQVVNKFQIAEKYGFDLRQAYYYADAARYLGLLDKITSNIYCLSPKGRCLQNMGYKERQLFLCGCILSHKIFADVLKLYFSCGIMPDYKEIIKLMKQSELFNIESDSTFRRRASTVRAWIEWIIGLINE